MSEAKELIDHRQFIEQGRAAAKAVIRMYAGAFALTKLQWDGLEGEIAYQTALALAEEASKR